MLAFPPISYEHIQATVFPEIDNKTITSILSFLGIKHIIHSYPNANQYGISQLVNKHLITTLVTVEESLKVEESFLNVYNKSTSLNPHHLFSFQEITREMASSTFENLNMKIAKKKLISNYKTNASISKSNYLIRIQDNQKYFCSYNGNDYTESSIDHDLFKAEILKLFNSNGEIIPFKNAVLNKLLVTKKPKKTKQNFNLDIMPIQEFFKSSLLVAQDPLNFSHPLGKRKSPKMLDNAVNTNHKSSKQSDVQDNSNQSLDQSSSNNPTTKREIMNIVVNNPSKDFLRSIEQFQNAAFNLSTSHLIVLIKFLWQEAFVFTSVNNKTYSAVYYNDDSKISIKDYEITDQNRFDYFKYTILNNHKELDKSYKSNFDYNKMLYDHFSENMHENLSEDQAKVILKQFAQAFSPKFAYLIRQTDKNSKPILNTCVIGYFNACYFSREIDLALTNNEKWISYLHIPETNTNLKSSHIITKNILNWSIGIQKNLKKTPSSEDSEPPKKKSKINKHSWPSSQENLSEHVTKKKLPPILNKQKMIALPLDNTANDADIQATQNYTKSIVSPTNASPNQNPYSCANDSELTQEERNFLNSVFI